MPLCFLLYRLILLNKLKEAKELVDQHLSNGKTEFQDSKTNIPLKISGMAVIYHWLLYCLLPFVGALLFAHMVEKRSFHEKIRARNENNS